MTNGLDLDQLQAQLELKRSALADSILAKLPGLSAAGTAAEATKQSTAASSSSSSSSSRPRQANLGVGATPTTSDASAANGKANGAADLRLKGALTAKRKRWQDEPVSRGGGGSDSDAEDVSRADAITASKKAKQQSGGSATATAKPAKKDPFASTGIEAQRAAQNQPRIVIVEGEEVDLSKLSKTQRKKINKQLKAQQQQSTDDSSAPAALSKAPETSAKQQKHSESTSPSTPKAAVKQSPASPAGGALTALQAQMLSKLSGSRFRTINEKLYTTASDEAVRMIDASPVMFDEYHQGFREQVRSWPKNPLDRIVDMFDPASAASVTKGSKAKAKSTAGASVSKFTKKSKARFTPGALVVDLGAGEGGLAKKLVPKGVKVLCYDLLTTKDGWVRKQDTAAIGGLPLPGYFDQDDPLGLQATPQDAAPGVADVAVFCLSLMGTNWIHMILEAKRVLRVGGELIIAEVSSRFDGFEAFVDVVQMLGFGLEHKDASNTHFVLFEFTRLDHAAHAAALRNTDAPALDPHTATLDQLASHGKQLLKPCIYKRR